MMNPIQRILTEFPALILDGALATELERHGCDLNDPLWSAKVLMENPALIKQVHKDYFQAGADCAITASYQTTFEGFAERGVGQEEAHRLIQQSVTLAVEARDEFWETVSNKQVRPKPIVAASVGPYGAFLADGSEYRGNYTISKDELVAFHRPRIQALIEAGADVLACETIPCLEEAEALVDVLREFPQAYAWITFSAKDEHYISDGTPITKCARFLTDYDQVVAIGVNCTPPAFIPSLITDIKSESNKPVVVYPNSGEQYNAVTKKWEGSSSGDYACEAKKWFEHGAELIGGCCRTKPDDIRAIEKLIRS